MIIQSIRNSDPQLPLNRTITVGIVVDTNDPQQMGRIRVRCPAWGDLDDKDNIDIPFALYAAPFGGQIRTMARGPEGNRETGAVSYGMWAIPKVGSHVLVACIDGHPEQRIWLGCLYGQYLPHTMPHGRYFREDRFGPFTSEETPIEPLYTNQETAFSRNGGRRSEEWQTRAADKQTSRISERALNKTTSLFADDEDQGYSTNQVLNTLGIDSQIYSITTPGFHAISMDDNTTNCRVRIRTTKGHQIILDDTNERVYISTAKGNNWVELDENGNVDIYSSRRISVHAESDINFTAGGSFRVHANGIHLYSSGETRIHSINDLNVKSGSNLRIQSSNNTYMESNSSLFIKTDSGLFAESDGDINMKSGGLLNLTATDDINVFSVTKDVFIAGKIVHTQGQAARPASPSIASDAKEAFWTNRVPEHEGWGRTMKINTDRDSNNTHTDELSYTSSNIGRVELDQRIPRNDNWMR